MDWAIRLFVAYVIIGEALLTYCLTKRQFRALLSLMPTLTLVVVVAWIVMLWPRCAWKAVRG